ncbi:hypothetical protein [Larkinella soli]|uniref:hypothetical protein n=1 Tax=Larkinella soli TaxID=1770527 RepID=UPI000FFC558F|nr:hypothetical protein [Larkinella soli]
MSPEVIEKILKKTGQPDLIGLLTESLSASELNSLLLEVFNRSVSRYSAPELLRNYQLNRFVKPVDLDFMRFRELETAVLNVFAAFRFQPQELSPVSALGSCSVVAPADQKKILSALRGTEVLADATNALALHIADLKQTGRWKPGDPSEQLRLSAVHRHVRTPMVVHAGHTPHFKIGCLVSAGRDTGDFRFEMQSVAEHLSVLTAVFRDTLKAENLRFKFMTRGGYDDPVRLLERVRDHICSQRSDVPITLDTEPATSNTYYKGLQYKALITVRGQEIEIGDGGFVDWTQQFLQNRKERLMTSGIGVEWFYRLMNQTT